MKKLYRNRVSIFEVFVLAVGLLLTFTVSADQRFESWQNLCHFAYDPLDDDNEVYYSSCENSIDTYDRQDGQGRLAYGSSTVTVIYDTSKGTVPKGINDPDTDIYLPKQIHLQGANTNEDGYITAANTPCVMVTSNYNAAADDNNETVYVSNDYLLDIESEIISLEDFRLKVTFTLDCVGGVAQ